MSGKEGCLMEMRSASRLGRPVSVVGLGTWQLGADWGDVGEDDARTILRTAIAEGVTFIDTADVYGDGRSEGIIGAVRADLGPDADALFIATKMGRRAVQDPAEFTAAAFRTWIDRSRRLLGMSTLDLVQLHCPPAAVLSSDAVYDALVADGSVARYGVSVETCAEALTALERPGVASLQIILNPFRLKPLEEVLPVAVSRGVAVIARVPLASGLLSGRYHADSVFAADDHRAYNRHGESFDVGETFSGVDLATGAAAVRELADLAPPGYDTAALALRWVIQQPGVTTVIPGATRPDQVVRNGRAATMDPLDEATLETMRDVYDRRIRPSVHPRW